MTLREAMKTRNNYYDITTPTEEDDILFIEAMDYLIHATKDADFMMELGGYYYDKRDFDLALKYYELANETQPGTADECLGYIWYYGRTGVKDYEKAFFYYSRSADDGNIVSAYKLADMYKNGYHVDKDYGKYCEIIESLYPKIQNAQYSSDPLPEIYTRLARIRLSEHREKEAEKLLRTAKYFLSHRIHYNPFFGNLNIMRFLIEDLYASTEFCREGMDLYDLYYVAKEPVVVTFKCGYTEYSLLTECEEGENAVCFEGKWYRTVTDFLLNARIDGERLTAMEDRLNSFTVRRRESCPR